MFDWNQRKQVYSFDLVNLFFMSPKCMKRYWMNSYKFLWMYMGVIFFILSLSCSVDKSNQITDTAFYLETEIKKTYLFMGPREFTYLQVCQPPIHLSPVCLPTSSPNHMFAYLRVCLPTCLLTYEFAFLQVCLPTWWAPQRRLNKVRSAIKLPKRGDWAFM